MKVNSYNVWLLEWNDFSEEYHKYKEIYAFVSNATYKRMSDEYVNVCKKETNGTRRIIRLTNQIYWKIHNRILLALWQHLKGSKIPKFIVVINLWIYRRAPVRGGMSPCPGWFAPARGGRGSWAPAGTPRVRQSQPGADTLLLYLLNPVRSPSLSWTSGTANCLLGRRGQYLYPGRSS